MNAKERALSYHASLPPGPPLREMRRKRRTKAEIAAARQVEIEHDIKAIRARHLSPAAERAAIYRAQSGPGVLKLFAYLARGY
jgi:hypothetical protein